MFGEIFSFVPAPKIKAEKGRNRGKYPLYTTGQQFPQRTDQSMFNGPALIISKTVPVSIYYCNGSFSATNDFMIAKANRNCFTQVDLQYVYFYLLGNLSLLEHEEKKSFSRQSIQKIEIPLNSLETQERIIGTLHKIETLIQKRGTNLLLVSELKKVMFLNFFGDPVLDKGKFLFSTPFHNLVTIHGGGNYQTQNVPRESKEQLAQLTQTAITRREFDPVQNKRFLHKQFVKDSHYIQKGDVLFSRKNSLKLIGSAAYVYDDIANLTIPDTIFRICCNPKKISGVYLTYLLNDENFNKQLRSYFGGTLPTMSSITTKKLKQFIIPCPDLALQHKFEKNILFLRQMEDRMTKQLSRLRQFISIASNDLFSGKEIIHIKPDLNALLARIDPENGNYDYSAFKDVPLVNELIRKISREEEEFPDIDMYNRAQKVLFALLKEGFVMQEYDPKKNKMNLHINETTETYN